MHRTIPAKVIHNPNPSIYTLKGFLFWTANRMLVLHTVLAVISIAWSILIRQWPQAIVIAGLWLIAFRLWLEWEAEEDTSESAGDIDLNENR